MKAIAQILRERNIVLEVADPVTAEGFTQVPNFVLRNPDLSVGAKLTYAMFLSYAWHEDCCFPGQDTLAEDIGVTRQSVNAFVAELQRAGFISVKRRGLGKTNIYTVKFRVPRRRR